MTTSSKLVRRKQQQIQAVAKNNDAYGFLISFGFNSPPFTAKPVGAGLPANKPGFGNVLFAGKPAPTT